MRELHLDATHLLKDTRTMKRFLLATCVSMLAGPALSGEIAGEPVTWYSQMAGDWLVEGFTTNGNTYCGATTAWTDNSVMMIAIQQDTREVSLMIINTEWFINVPQGTPWDFRTNFYKDGSFAENFISTADMGQNPQTVFVRDLSLEFFKAWMNYDRMIIDMPGDIVDLDVSLSGTINAVEYMAICKHQMDG